MREFGENPKRAGTVSERLGLNAPRALNVSSPLERSEKVGRKSLEIFSGSQVRRPILGEFDRGVGIPLSFAVGIAATAVFQDCRGCLLSSGKIGIAGRAPKWQLLSRKVP